MKLIDRLIELIISGYKYVLLILLILSVPLFYYFIQQEHFNHIDIYFDKDDYELNLYREFQETYGNEEFIVIVFKDDNIFTVKNINLIKKITASLEVEKGVQKVVSLTNVVDARSRGELFEVKPIVPEGALNQEILDGVRKNALDNELVVNAVISEDGRTTSILVEIEPLVDREKSALLNRLMRKSEAIAGDRVRLYYGGMPYAEMELNNLSRHDFLTFTPLIFVVVFAIVFLMLKNLTLSLLCQANILMILMWSIGIFVFAGEKFNLVNTIMGGILLAIAVADGIHVLAHFKDEYDSYSDLVPALERSLKHVWLPCLFTSITTAIGFVSFLTSTLMPVKVLGVFTAIGIMVALFLTMTFLPASITLLKRRIHLHQIDLNRKGEDSDRFFRVLHSVGEYATTHYRGIGIMFFIILVIAISGIFRMKFETNTMNYLPKENRVRSDIEFIEENITGTVPYVILIKAKSKENNFNKRQSLLLVEKIQEDLMKGVEAFTTSYSIADYFKTLNRAYNDNLDKFYTIPEIQSDILDFYELGDYEILNRLVSPDFMEAKLSFQLVCQTDEEGYRIYRFISDYLKDATGENFTYEITGLATLYANMEDRLKQSQIQSFSVAFVIIFIMLLFVCKSFKLALVCMIPNIFPIAATLGFMGWFGIPLDVVTVMIASITLGIAVDDTIHYVVWFKRNAESGMDTKSALLKAYRDVGKPIVITSFVLFLGFFIFILGSIIPTRIFGVLTAFSMISALIADLFFLPAIILIVKPGIKEVEDERA